MSAVVWQTKLKPRRASARQRILVFRIGNLGDTIISLPSMWAIRRQFPDAHIALLGNSNGQHVVARSVLPESNLFDDWLTYPTNENGATELSPALLRLLLKLRSEKFETLVYLAPRARSAWQIKRDLVFFRAAGIKNFLGHRGFAPLPVRLDAAPQPAVEHEADHLLARLRTSGVEVPRAGDGDMNLNLTTAESEAAVSWLAQNCGTAFFESRLIGIGAGSKWPSKVWLETRFAELGRKLIAELNLFPVIFGGPEDRELGERLLANWQCGVNAAGVLNIRTAAAALQNCVLYVGNDTGTMHLAAAVKTRCVAIFAAQDWRGRWYPYGTEHLVLREFVPCENCLLAICPNDKLCLRAITVEQVFNACQHQLRQIENNRFGLTQIAAN